MRAKVYRNLEQRPLWLGLEPFDAVALGVVAWLLMIFNGSAFGWNLLATVVGYVSLRLGKRGKPDGYTTALFRFYVLRFPFFSAAIPDSIAPDRLQLSNQKRRHG